MSVQPVLSAESLERVLRSSEEWVLNGSLIQRISFNIAGREILVRSHLLLQREIFSVHQFKQLYGLPLESESRFFQREPSKYMKNSITPPNSA